MSDDHDEPESLKRSNVRMRFFEGGPEVDLGFNAVELLEGALTTLDSLSKTLKPEHVSPILTHVLKRLAEAKKSKP